MLLARKAVAAAAVPACISSAPQSWHYLHGEAQQRRGEQQLRCINYRQRAGLHMSLKVWMLQRPNSAGAPATQPTHLP